MSYIGAVNIIKGVAEAVNTTGIFVHGRTWDASLEFNSNDIQIYLYPFTGTVDLNNSYYESYQITMGFYFQDAPDSTNEERQALIQRADILTREFLATLNLIEGVEVSGSRVEPSYRKMAGTYTGYILSFTFGIDTNICGADVEPDIPNVPTFCEKVDTCLGISEIGSSTKYLNEQGNWTTPAGGGGGATVIEKTKAEFLALVNVSTLEFPATYKITDIAGFSALYVNTTSANTFDGVSSGLLFTPDYTVSGNDLGQLNANDIQTVNAGERCIWGAHYWENNSGGSVTPTIVDYTSLDTPMTVVEKVSGNGYLEMPVVVLVDFQMNIFEITNPAYGTHYRIDAGLVAPYLNTPYLYSQFNYDKLGGTDVTGIYNHYSDEKPSSFVNKFLDNDISNNTGGHQNIIFEGSGNTYKNNIALNGAAFKDIKLFNTGTITNCYADLSDSSSTAVGWIDLWDNCIIDNCSFQGANSWLWDVRTGENSQILNLDFTGSASGLSDLDMMFGERVQNIIINGENIDLKSWDMTNNCTIENFNITADNSTVRSLVMLHSKLSGVTMTSEKHIEVITMNNCTIQNVSNINIQGLFVYGKGIDDTIIDLTGFSQDINSETIEAGIGWFTIEHDFSASPLTSGNSLLFNLIPTGAKLTSLAAIGDLVGTDIEIGLETDDEAIINTAVGLLPLSWDGVSNASTANSSLKIKATGGDITSGTLTVKVEFAL